MNIVNPYGKLTGGSWKKGNLHTHTTASDGERIHQDVIDDYSQRGYGFLMFSDHDVFTAAETYASLKDRGLILIPGNEISASGPHMLHVGGASLIGADPDRQKVVDAINNDAGFAVFNHPNWQSHFNHCPQELLESCTDYAGIEIYNGVISRLEGSPYATDRWDMLLGKGRKVWGFGNDDSHKAEGDIGWGWNTAYVTDPTPEGVTEALRTGRFYVSTGVEIREIRTDGSRIDIVTENAERIVALVDNGKRLGQVDDASISVEAPSGSTYIRFECWGPGESFAWTQPFYIEP
jgi:hypothetical protein